MRITLTDNDDLEFSEFTDRATLAEFDSPQLFYNGVPLPPIGTFGDNRQNYGFNSIFSNFSTASNTAGAENMMQNMQINPESSNSSNSVFDPVKINSTRQNRQKNVFTMQNEPIQTIKIETSQSVDPGYGFSCVNTIIEMNQNNRVIRRRDLPNGFFTRMKNTRQQKRILKMLDNVPMSAIKRFAWRFKQGNH